MARHCREFTEHERKTVEAMAGYGIKQDDIAAVLGCDNKTLRKHCRVELDTGGTKATAKVAESLYTQAINGNVSAAIFWMKARAGWSERYEHSGPGGEGIIVRVVKHADDRDTP